MNTPQPRVIYLLNGLMA